MDSLEFEKESVSEKSILQVNNSTEKESSKDEKPFYDTIEKGEVLTNYKSERSVQSSEEEQVLNSDTSANEITEDNSHLNESSEENINGVNETVSDRHDDELEESIQHEEPVEGMEIEDDVNEDKNQNQKTVNDSIKLPRFVEVEEEFTGFTPKSDESQVYNIIKDLSQQEEVELKQLENMVDNNVELRPMSPPKKKRKEGEESQGSDMSSQCSSPALSISSQLSAVSNTKRSVTGSPASRGSRKSTADLSNPKYLVPFEHGWRREVVTRAVTSRDDGISKDVYYFHPSGKKLRSLREVTEKCKLTPGLTIDNFTFYKEPLGADPKYETVRNARAHGQSQSPSDFGTPRTPLPAKIKNENVFVKDEFAATPPVKNVLRTPRDRTIAKREKIVLKFNKGTPKIALKKSPAVNGDRKSPKSIIPKLDGPKPHPLAPEGPRRKITPRKSSLSIGKSKDETGANTANNQGGGGDMEMGMLPPTWSPTAGSNKSSSNESLSWSQLDEEKSANEESRLDPCTIRCTKAMGLIPTLQCSLCLCLYHPECCDMGPTASFRPSMKYICKNCQSLAIESKSRNLVKHITPAVVTSDKNPPIISPKPIHPNMAPSPTGQSNPNIPRPPQHIRPKLNISMPGNVNTWLPPTSTVFRSPNIPKPSIAKPEEAFPPQMVVNINSKRYIVVPKHNVVAVANQNQSAKPDPAQISTIITPTPTSTIIQGPPWHSNPFIQHSNNSSGVSIVPYIPNENVSQESTPQQYQVVNPLPASSTTQPDLPVGSTTPNHFPKENDKTVKVPSSDGIDDSMQKFMRNICIGYSALLHVFQYLKVQELLRAGRVCRLWRDLASHPSLWRTVRMKNSQVSDWKGFTDSLSRHGTKHLDLRKMLVSLDESEEMWKTLAKHISNVQCLERLDMCRCSVGVIEQIVEACPQLLVFNAPMIGVKDPTVQQKISLDSFSKMTKLTELRMKSFFGLYLNGSLQSLTSLADTLTTLSLTSVKDLGSVNVEFIGDLNLLETLELGECSNLPEEFPTEVIAKLKKLKRIRLEKGPYKCSTNQMLLEMSKLPDLVQLELINFDIKHGFDDALATCTNIKRLLLIPTYVTQSATTNNIILSGAFKLHKTLLHFVWVVTMELLKVTELFIDQCEGPNSKKGGGNSVPVLKPVPKPQAEVALSNSQFFNNNEDSGQKSNPITVIQIDDLYEMLREALPTTQVKLLKIPFQNTWRQCITETNLPL